MKPASPIGLANLGPLAQLKAGRLPERVLRLLVGLWLYGLAIALEAQGATMKNLVSVNIYVTDLRPENTARIREIRSAYFDTERPPAVSLLGIERLAFEGLRVEIEATAAV
mgnify:CR=1 FL=1